MTMCRLQVEFRNGSDERKNWFAALNLEVSRVDEKVVEALFHQQPFCRNLVKGNPTEPDKKKTALKERQGDRSGQNRQEKQSRKLIVFLGN